MKIPEVPISQEELENLKEVKEFREIMGRAEEIPDIFEKDSIILWGTFTGKLDQVNELLKSLVDYYLVKEEDELDGE